MISKGIRWEEKETAKEGEDVDGEERSRRRDKRFKKSSQMRIAVARLWWLIDTVGAETGIPHSAFFSLILSPFPSICLIKTASYFPPKYKPPTQSHICNMSELKKKLRWTRGRSRRGPQRFPPCLCLSSCSSLSILQLCQCRIPQSSTLPLGVLESQPRTSSCPWGEARLWRGPCSGACATDS